MCLNWNVIAFPLFIFAGFLPDIRRSQLSRKYAADAIMFCDSHTIYDELIFFFFATIVSFYVLL